MGLKQAAIFAKSTEGMARSLQNLRSIRESRRKTEQQETAFDLKKQEAELRIKNLELEGTASELELDQKRELFKRAFATQKTVLDGNKAQQSLAEAGEMNKIESFSQIANSLTQDQDVQNLLLGDSVIAATDQLKSEIPESVRERSIATNINPNIPFANDPDFRLKEGATFGQFTEDPASVTEFRQQKRKRNIVTVDESGKPTVTGRVDRDAFIIRTEGGDEFELPASITKFTEAVKYLINTKGLSEEEATRKAEELLT